MNWRFWNRTRHDDCNSIEPMLSLYSDGMASPAEMRRVEAHLPDCPHCQQTLRWMQATHRVISQRPALTPPADLRARIARAIADAEAAQAPAAKTPARPARRPLVLRPALAYGLSLAVFAAVAGEIAWQSAVPTDTHVVAKPAATAPVSPRVADKAVPPAVTSVINHAMSHVNHTLRTASANVLSPSHMPFLTAHRKKTPALERMARADVSAPVPEPGVFPVQSSRPLTSLTHKTAVPITRMAAKPSASRPAFSPPVVTPLHRNDQQVASASVPPLDVVHTPTVTTPQAVQVKVGPPTISPDTARVAERTPTTIEIVRDAVAHMQGSGNGLLPSHGKVVNYVVHVAVADVSTDHSGTLPLTYGPLR